MKREKDTIKEAVKNTECGLIIQIEEVLNANYVSFMESLVNSVNIHTDHIKLIIKSHELDIVAFDRRRLAINTMKLLDDVPNVFFLTISRKTFIEIMKIFNKNDKISLINDNNTLMLSQNNTEVLLKTIHDGQLAYERFMNLDVYMNVSVNCSVFLKIIQQILTISDGNLASFVKLQFKQNQLLIGGFNPNVGSSQMEIPISDCSMELDITLNGEYLLETLQCFNNGMIDIYISNNVKPLIIKQNNCYHIIMPIRQ